MLGDVNGKWSKWLPYVFMLVAALSRWPKLFPPNFSAFYGLCFCAGAFFPHNVKWWLPLGTLVVTDIALDFYYQSFGALQLVNYVAYALIILFGTRFNHRSRFLGLLAGGIMGLIGGYLLQYYVTVWQFPINIGGRPLHSWPSYIVIAFETTILCAAGSAVLGLLALCGLPMPYHPVFNVRRFALASRNRFFLCIEAADPLFDRDATSAFLHSLEPREVSEVAQ